MTNRFSRLLAAATAAVLAATGAQADDFTFSFTGNAGTLSGTVTGTVYGLPHSGTAAPTNVTASFDGVTYTYATRGVFGALTTLNGVVTGAGYQTTLDPSPANLTLGYAGFDQLITRTNDAIINTNGFAAITFTPVTSSPAPAVPEPASWAMMILGFGVAGLALRRQLRRSDAAFDARIKRMTAGEIA